MALIAVTSSLAKVVKVVDIPLRKKAQKLSEFVSSEEKYTIDSICVKGGWSNTNFQFLKDCVKNGRLTGIDLSEANITDIPNEAFCPLKINGEEDRTPSVNANGLSNLQYLRLPKTVVNIGSYAFSHTSLRCVTIPKVIEIGSGAFAKCPFLESVTVPFVAPPSVDQEAFDDNRENITLYVPSGSKAAYQSDMKWHGFKEIKEEDGLFVTRGYYLDGQTLESMVGDEDCMIDSMKISGYMTLDDYAVLRRNVLHGRLSGIDLSGCRIEKDNLPPRGFTEWDGEFLYEPVTLRYFQLPKDLVSLDVGALSHARLQSLTIPSTVRKIYSQFFTSGYLNGDLVIPEGVEFINVAAFHETEIKGDVYVPSTLSLIGSMVFGFWPSNLDGKKFYYNRMYPSPTIGENVCLFDYWDADWFDMTLYVPVGAKAAFAADENWGKFRHIIETPTLDGGVTAGINSVQTVEMKKTDMIYTLDGRYLGSDIKALKSGVYVINGKKVVK